MKSPVFICLLLLSCTILLSCKNVQAELSGNVPGRGANISVAPKLSIELGATWFTEQLRWSSIRINAKLSSNLLSYFDLAKLQASNLPTDRTSRASFAGTGFGGGLVFSVPDPFNKLDLAIKAAFHAAKINQSSVRETRANMVLTQSQWSTDVIVSPIDPVFENGVSWYASLGLVSTSAHANARDSAHKTVYRRKAGSAFGFGLLKPMARGSLYGGLGWVAGEPLVGVGLRYAF